MSVNRDSAMKSLAVSSRHALVTLCFGYDRAVEWEWEARGP